MSSASPTYAQVDRVGTTTRSIYLFMAVLFVLTAVVGFAPTSLALVGAVISGQRPVPPPTLHIHAAAMTSWLLLFLTQAVLMGRGRRDLHFKLGAASFVLAPIMWVAMVVLATSGSDVIAQLSPDLDPAQVSQIKERIANALLINADGMLFFPIFFAWAIAARNRDADTHKRMMVLATLAVMTPAVGRMLILWLPDLGLSPVDARHLYLLLLLMPALVHDFVKRGAPHRAYLFGLTVFGSYMVAAHFLWGSAWWLESASKLLGLD